MPEFTYTARTGAGEKVQGTVSAGNRREAVAALSAQALFPLEVEANTPVATNKTVRRVPAQLLATTYAQLADLLRSGVPLLRALEVLRRQTSHAGLSAVLEVVHRHVEDGSTLAEAMARFPHVFGEMPISMVRAGGEGGFLEEVLQRVAQFTETQEDLKKRTWGAMAYPLFLMAVGAIVVTVLLVFFVPNFEGLFAQLRKRGELPAVTDWLLAFSAVLRSYGLILLVLAGAAIWFLRRHFLSDAGRVWWDRTRLYLPLIGPIMLQLAVARFCRVLGTLLHNGVPLLRSLDISSDATGNRILAAAIRQATENISAGQPLAGPLAACGHFPVTVVEMIAVAEQANNLETVLLDISEGLERRTWRRMELAVRLLEPILLLILATVVLLVVIALLLPVLRLSSAIQ